VRGLKRRNFSEQTIEALRHAYKLVYKSGLRLSEATEQLAQMDANPEVRHFLDFIKQSERGIVR
jgi:UDP-N-acetylglucosamine acyltransferase